MGRMQREKGKRFERAIADEIRQRWPKVVVRRASQAERADNPDVFCEGNAVLERLWLELQDARSPTPIAKLEQAEADALWWQARRDRTAARYSARWPVVIWHRLGERTTHVTLRLGTLLQIMAPNVATLRSDAVTLALESFLALIADRDDAEVVADRRSA